MITPDDLLLVPLFALLTETMRSRIAARAGDVRVNAGEWIVQDGDPPYFWAMLEGEVEAIKLVAGIEQQATTFDPGEYFGEVPLMLGGARFRRDPRDASVAARAYRSRGLPRDGHAV